MGTRFTVIVEEEVQDPEKILNELEDILQGPRYGFVIDDSFAERE